MYRPCIAVWQGPCLLKNRVRQHLNIFVCLYVCFSGPVDFVSCDHMLATEYFLDSILPQCPMRAYPCPSAADFDHGRCLRCSGSCPTFGYNSVDSKGKTSGKFFLYNLPLHWSRRASLWLVPSWGYCACGWRGKLPYKKRGG